MILFDYKSNYVTFKFQHCLLDLLLFSTLLVQDVIAKQFIDEEASATILIGIFPFLA